VREAEAALGWPVLSLADLRDPLTAPKICFAGDAKSCLA
jgi:hypothetical protein